MPESGGPTHAIQRADPRLAPGFVGSVRPVPRPAGSQRAVLAYAALGHDDAALQQKGAQLVDQRRPWARRAARLGSIQRHIGFAMGGEPGPRLAARLSMPLSGDTLLRLIGRAELEPHPPPRVTGIDDWAWRRGQRYGTIICDLERRRVIDILPERSTEAVTAWLQKHPGVEVIARDRADAYAEGADKARPMPSRSLIVGTCCAI